MRGVSDKLSIVEGCLYTVSKEFFYSCVLVGKGQKCLNQMHSCSTVYLHTPIVYFGIGFSDKILGKPIASSVAFGGVFHALRTRIVE